MPMTTETGGDPRGEPIVARLNLSRFGFAHSPEFQRVSQSLDVSRCDSSC
jgi:hypothetical protein